MTVRSCFMLALASAVVGLGVAGGPAWAQAPPNDSFEQATKIPSVPFSQTLDTSEATTDGTDAEASAVCGTSVGAAGVWYQYTPSVDQSLVISATGYSAGVAVLTGSPGGLSAVSCFAGIGTFSAIAGQTYHIGVADIGGGNGGTLDLSVEANGVELNVDPVGRLDPNTGVATVTGTLTCPSGFTGTVSGTLTQQEGDQTTTAATLRSTNVPCNGAARQWSAAFRPLEGNFIGGNAGVSVNAIVCLPRGCVADHADRSLILRTDAPAITSMTPSDGECGVSRVAPISVLFDNPMDKPSVEAAFSLKRTSNGDPVSGSFSWFGNLLEFTPSTSLSAARVYSATVGTGARNLAGTHLAAPKIWQFTTTPQPLISFVYPIDGAAGIPPDAPVVVAFDTGMDKPSAQAAFSLKRTSNGVPVSGSFGWFGNALIFKPASALASGVSYTASETNGAKNLAGRRVESGRTWVFSVDH